MADPNQGNDPGQGASMQIAVGQQIVQSLNAILTALKAFFPSSVGTSSSATAGAATLPANPVGFLNITLPNGNPAKVPYYSP